VKFIEALHVFKNELLKEYGPDAEIIKIGISYELYNKVMTDIFSYGKWVNFVSLNEPTVLGVSIVPREKDDF
jgi:hypothetical protein